MRMESVDITDQNIDKIASLFPSCITEAKDENGKLNYSAEELIEVLKKLDVTGVDAYPQDNCIDAEYINKVKDAGFEFHVWTINRFNTAKELYDMGVDSITTDCPSDLMKEFNKQSK